MPPTVLMVAEKPSICTAIANALSKGNMQTRGIMYIPRIYIPS
jgi:DNA topoisomerase IA